MKFWNLAAVLVIGGLASSPAHADLSASPDGKYVLDNTHGYITFAYSHLGFSNPHVGFNKFDVTLDLDSDNPEESTVNVTIDTASIDSRVEEFDGHLNGEKFFDTAKYPTATFASTSINKTGDNTYDVVGDLTLKGVAKPVTLAMKVNKAAEHPFKNVAAIGLAGETKVMRSDWGLGANVPMVGDEVTIWIETELHHAPAE